MIKVNSNTIKVHSDVVRLSNRTPKEIFGSDLKVWCPINGLGSYANSAALLAGVGTYSNITDSTVSTTAGSDVITTTRGGIIGLRVVINSIEAFCKTQLTSTTIRLETTWMNETVYPTTQTNVPLYFKIINTLFDKSGNNNHMTTISGRGTYVILKNKQIGLGVGAAGTNTGLSSPTNLLTSATKIVFGMKINNISISTAERNIINHPNFYVAFFQLNSINYIKVTCNGYIINQPIITENNDTVAVFYDQPAQIIWIRYNSFLGRFYCHGSAFSSTSGFNLFDNAPNGLNVTNVCIAHGSGVSLDKMNEVFEYLKYS